MIIELSCNNFQHCIIEGDARICIDARNRRNESYPWPLFAICQDVKTLLKSSSLLLLIGLKEMQIHLHMLWPNLLSVLVVFPVVIMISSLPR